MLMAASIAKWGATVSARLGLLRNAPMTRPYVMPSICCRRLDIRCGSFATEMGYPRYVRFSPDSDRRTDIAGCLKRANRRHRDLVSSRHDRSRRYSDLDRRSALCSVLTARGALRTFDRLATRQSENSDADYFSAKILYRT